MITEETEDEERVDGWKGKSYFLIKFFTCKAFFKEHIFDKIPL
jgi:hypothetical protein